MNLRSRTLTVNAERTPLGRIPLAGVVQHGTGIPFTNMRVLGSYAIVYLLQGGGRYADAKGFEQPLVPGDMITLFPELPHAYGPMGNRRTQGGWGEIYIVFEGPMFDLLRKQGLLDDIRPVRHIEPLEYWYRRMESAAIGADGGAGASLLAVSRLQEVLVELFLRRRESAAENDADREWLSRAKAALEAKLSADDTLESVAAQFDMSYVGFRRKFARLAGMPPAKYHAKSVMDLACALIRGEGLSNKQLAARCGFCDEFHFSRRFRQVVGLSPKEFRRQVVASPLGH